MCQHVRSERARVRESKRGRTKLKKGEGRGYRVIGIHAHKEVNECVKKMCVVCVFHRHVQTVPVTLPSLSRVYTDRVLWFQPDE